jgi:hypothetical protein
MTMFRNLRRAVVGTVAALALAAAAAGCSSGSSSKTDVLPVAAETAATETIAPDSSASTASVSETTPLSGGPTTTLSRTESGIAFTKCLRQNGIDVADPDASGRFPQIPTGPAADAAVKKCQSLLGASNGGAPKMTPEFKAQILAMAKCMRDSGYPDFPDPTITDAGVTFPDTPGINQDDPKVQDTLNACMKKTNFDVTGGAGQ